MSVPSLPALVIALFLAAPIPGVREEATLDFQLRANLIVLEVKCNGKEMLFVLDTGASVTVVGRETARRLGLKEIRKAVHRGAKGDVTGGLVNLDSLDVGGMKLPDVEATTLDLGGLKGLLGDDVKGILGFDFLSQFRITIDYPERQVTFQKTRGSGEGRGARGVIEGDHFRSPLHRVALKRPDASWTMTTDTPLAGTLVILLKEGTRGRMDLQVQEVHGVPLERLLPSLEPSLKTRVKSFRKTGTSRRKVAGTEAHQIDFTGRDEGVLLRYQYVVVKVKERLFSFISMATPLEFPSLKKEFEAVLQSVDFSGED